MPMISPCNQHSATRSMRIGRHLRAVVTLMAWPVWWCLFVGVGVAWATLTVAAAVGQVLPQAAEAFAPSDAFAGLVEHGRSEEGQVEVRPDNQIQPCVVPKITSLTFRLVRRSYSLVRPSASASVAMSVHNPPPSKAELLVNSVD